MSELNKQLSEQLAEVLAGLPGDVQATLQQRWTDEAIGAKKVCDMTEKAEEKSARDAEAESQKP